MAALIARARRTLRYRGWRRSLRILGRWLLHPSRQAFDLEYGVATGGAPPAPGERRGPRGVAHGPVDPTTFAEIFRHIEVDRFPFTFVDFGCGLGRALMLASEYPFQRIVGVEYDRELYRQALANLARFRSPRQRCTQIQVEWGDATELPLPTGPSVFYLNEPFYATGMRRTAARIRASLTTHPRPAYVVYLGDWFCGVWEAAGDFEVIAVRGDDHLYRWRGW
ncbi:MAG TPA: hypothetical protein VN515_00500 [Terriglobales bacterium]|nr:hypothetical protein [Terriglobales bacterium]